MLTALIVLVAAVSGLVLILLVVVLAGIRREPPARSNQRDGAPADGVYVRRPDAAADDADSRRDACLAGHGNGEGR